MSSTAGRLAAVVAVLSLSGCTDGTGEGDPDAASDVCAVAEGRGVSFDADATLCDRLSSYRFFVGQSSMPAELAELAPNQGVVPYDLNSPLFSDYTAKYRFVWLPPGTSMSYHDTGSFDMPVGTALLKTFAYLDDIREPQGGRRLLETRILYRTSSAWEGITYVWNEDQTEAYRQVAGDIIPASWIHHDGQERQIAYSVPNKNQCKNCHEEHDDVVGPIGPKARHLNRDLPDVGGNQLVHLAEIGYLTGLPADPAAVPRAPVWDDETSGTLDERARARGSTSTAPIATTPAARRAPPGSTCLTTRPTPMNTACARARWPRAAARAAGSTTSCPASPTTPSWSTASSPRRWTCACPRSVASSWTRAAWP
jgi:uncharacterized repeat protein (TIGR03806 family)